MILSQPAGIRCTPGAAESQAGAESQSLGRMESSIRLKFIVIPMGDRQILRPTWRAIRDSARAEPAVQKAVLAAPFDFA
jgi:hypothetical protein